MKIIFIVLISFIFLTFKLQGQTNNLLQLKKIFIQEELKNLDTPSKVKRKKGIGNAMLNLYQKHISVLISADCLYSLSCSRYSREAINKYNLFSGILLTADRLTWCSSICSKDIPDSNFDDNGLAEDNP